MRSRLNFSSPVLLSLLCIVAGCYEPKEGCLDIAATNFDPTADENCCCLYPGLIFAVDHLADTIRIHPDSIYYDHVGHPFRIPYFQFYISDIRLTNSDGVVEQVVDTIRVYYPAGGGVDSVAVTDDITLIHQDAFSFAAGTLRATGVFEKIQFRIGLAAPVLYSAPGWYETGHPLAVQAPAMWDSLAGYYSLNAGILRDTAQPDIISAIRAPAIHHTVELEFLIPIAAIEGYDTELTLQVDYLKWLEGIDVLADSEVDMIAKIVNNTANAIKIE